MAAERPARDGLSIQRRYDRTEGAFRACAPDGSERTLELAALSRTNDFDAWVIVDTRDPDSVYVSRPEGDVTDQRSVGKRRSDGTGRRQRLALAWGYGPVAQSVEQRTHNP